MPEMFDQKEAAIMLGISWETLRQYRRDGTGPAWYRIGRNAVRYRRTDVEAYLEARRVAA